MSDDLKKIFNLWHISRLVSQVHQMENCLTYAFNNEQTLGKVLEDRNQIRALLNKVLGVIGFMIGDIEVYIEQNGLYKIIQQLSCPDVYDVMLVVENPMLHLAWVYEILQMVEYDVEELSRLSKTPRGQRFYDQLMPMAIDMSQLKVLMVNLEKIARSPNNDDDGEMKMEKSPTNDHPVEVYMGERLRVVRLLLNVPEEQIYTIFYDLKKSTQHLHKISKEIFQVVDNLMVKWPPTDTIYYSRTLLDAKLKVRSCLVTMINIVVKMMSHLELTHERHRVEMSNEEVSRDSKGQMDLAALVTNPKKQLSYLTNLVRQLEFVLLKSQHQIFLSIFPEHFIRYANVLRDGLVNVDQCIIDVYQLCQPQDKTTTTTTAAAASKEKLDEDVIDAIINASSSTPNLVEQTKGETEKKRVEFQAQFNLCAALILGLGEDNEEGTAAAAGQMDKESTTTLSHQMTVLSLIDENDDSVGEKSVNSSDTDQ
jgi:hypothetical protein